MNIFEKTYDKLETYYYNVKYTIINFYKYAGIVSRYRPWDYEYMLEMMKFQLEQLCDTIDKYGMEIEEEKDKKVKNMRRAIEILDCIINESYPDRCGYISDAVNLNIDKKTYKITCELNPKYPNYNEAKVFSDAEKLRKKEWNELFELLKTMEGWWD